MINVPMKSCAPLTKQTVSSLNEKSIQQPKSLRELSLINNSSLSTPVSSWTTGTQSGSTQSSTAFQQAVPDTVSFTTPPLLHTVQKGQKAVLSSAKQLNGVKACLGWNFNSVCDVDVSAFMLNQSGKVLGDTWFVFYGQPQSPDNSTLFHEHETADLESITIDFTKINPSVSKIVFVLTINDALINNYNFSMIKDAYVRILDLDHNQELVSFKMDEYYSNVTSMMIGEIYLHNNIWKFNAIGNGVAKDLAGLCELYGVQVI